MELQIIVDNLCSKSGMLAEWGFSAWLTDSENEQNILLDTGGPLHALEHNLKFLRKDPSRGSTQSFSLTATTTM